MSAGIKEKGSDVHRRKFCFLWMLSQIILVQITYPYPPYLVIVVLSLGDHINIANYRLV